MARGAATGLILRPDHRIARPVDIHDRHQLLDAGPVQPFGRLDPLQLIGMDRALIAAHLMLGLGQHQQPARAEHDVIVQVLAQRLVKAACLLEDRRRGILEIIRADDRGIAPGIAATQPALLDNRDIGDAEILAKVIGRGKTMAASADDNDIIGGFGLWRAPGPFPPLMPAKCLARDGKDGIAFHGLSFVPHSGPSGMKPPFRRARERRNREKYDMTPHNRPGAVKAAVTAAPGCDAYALFHPGRKA